MCGGVILEFWKNLTSHFPTRTSHSVANQRNCSRLGTGEGPGLVGWAGYVLSGDQVDLKGTEGHMKKEVQ